MGHESTEQALRALEPLVGEWTLEARGPDGQPWPGAGHASFEWHTSGAHLVQRVVIDAPGAPASTSIIGCDAANGTYIQLYTDERGVCRIYTMRIDARHWTLHREGEPFSQRFIATISDDARTISGGWEKAENGTEFMLDFHLTYRKDLGMGEHQSPGGQDHATDQVTDHAGEAPDDVEAAMMRQVQRMQQRHREGGVDPELADRDDGPAPGGEG
jgi:hypothetical protein